MTNVVLYFVTPCVILNSFQRKMETDLLKDLLIVGGLSVLIHIISIAIAHLVIKDNDDTKKRVFRFATVFSNCGFMSLPLQEALLGDTGVFLGSVYIAVFNVVLWTYGLVLMSGNVKDIKISKLVLNPGILGTLFGLIVFFLGISFPPVLSAPIRFMAALNTPVPMLIIGFYLGNLSFKHLTMDKKKYLSIFLRLIVIPLISISLMYLFKVDHNIFLVCTIACCAPTATVTAMFANRFGRDASLGAQMVSVATLLSLISLPVMVTIAQTIST